MEAASALDLLNRLLASEIFAGASGGQDFCRFLISNHHCVLPFLCVGGSLSRRDVQSVESVRVRPRLCCELPRRADRFHLVADVPTPSGRSELPVTRKSLRTPPGRGAIAQWGTQPGWISEVPGPQLRGESSRRCSGAPGSFRAGYPQSSEEQQRVEDGIGGAYVDCRSGAGLVSWGVDPNQDPTSAFSHTRALGGLLTGGVASGFVVQGGTATRLHSARARDTSSSPARRLLGARDL